MSDVWPVKLNYKNVATYLYLYINAIKCTYRIYKSTN